MIQKFKEYTPEIDGTCFIAQGSAVIGKVKIGADSSIWHNAVLRGDITGIIIGEGSNIQDCSVLHCIKDIEVRIGDNVTVGHGAILHSCEIGDCTLVGMGSIILDGAKIGKNCIVGAGAVVTPNTVVPDGSMVLGSPAKIKRELTSEEIKNIRKNAEEYISLAREYASMEI